MANKNGKTRSSFSIDIDDHKQHATLRTSTKKHRASRAESSTTFDEAKAKRADMFSYPFEGIMFHIVILILYSMWTVIEQLDTLWVWISYLPLCIFIVILKKGILKNGNKYFSDLIPFRCYVLMLVAFTAGNLQKTIRLVITGCTLDTLSNFDDTRSDMCKKQCPYFNKYRFYQHEDKLHQNHTLVNTPYLCRKRSQQAIGGPLAIVMLITVTFVGVIHMNTKNIEEAAKEEIELMKKKNQYVKDILDTDLNIEEDTMLHQDRPSLFVHLLGISLGVTASVGMIMDAIESGNMTAGPIFHIIIGIFGNMCIGQIIYILLFWRLNAMYLTVFKHMKSLTRLVTNEIPSKLISPLGAIYGQEEPLINNIEHLKAWVIARELLLGIIQPIYRYAAVAFLIMVISWLYIFTQSVIQVAISFFSENKIGPLSRVSNNDGNLSAYVCIGICLTCWVLHAFFQIYQIGTEQDFHATSLRKSAFAMRLTNKVKSQEGLKFAELCAGHMEKYDSYPRALLGVQMPPKTFYVIAGYVVTALSGVVAMQSNIKFSNDGHGMNETNMILMGTFSLFYVIVHFLLAGRGQDSISIKNRRSLDRDWVGSMPDIFTNS